MNKLKKCDNIVWILGYATERKENHFLQMFLIMDLAKYSLKNEINKRKKKIFQLIGYNEIIF